MVNNYTIQQASNADCAKIQSLIFDIWINEYNFKVHLEDYPDLQDITTYYHDRGGCFYVAVVNGVIVGTIAYDLLSDKIYVLKRMFVAHRFRRQGVAQKLLQSVFNDLPSASQIYLSTKKDQAIAAQRFYSKNGFESIAKQMLPESFPLFYEDDLFMRKVLVKDRECGK